MSRNFFLCNPSLDKTLENITNTCEKCGEHLNELEKVKYQITFINIS